MNPLLVALAALLVPIALYFILRRPMRGGDGGDRADYKNEPRELTGNEQRKQRKL